MLNTQKTWMSWSSGKDSAFALLALQQRQDLKITSLLTTITEPYNRVSMHGVREELLDQQAYQMQLPIQKVHIPNTCVNEIYQKKMKAAIVNAQNDNIACIGFGDIFLEDVKDYRVKMMQGTGIEPIFPLWGQCSKTLAHAIIQSGIKAVLTCVDLSKLPKSFLGRTYDFDLLAELPEHIDPCGENGEFHTFVYDSPMFAHAINITQGECVMRDGFGFCDVRMMN